MSSVAAFGSRKGFRGTLETEDELVTARDQMQDLVRIIVGIGSNLDLDVTLHRIVDGALELTGARGGALGTRTAAYGSTSLVASGLDSESIAALGELPTDRIVHGDELAGRGVRVNGSPGRAVLGVPVVVRAAEFGILYLADDRSERVFADGRERAVRALATAAAAAIDNARLFERAREAAKWMKASRNITTALLSGAPQTGPLQLIVQRALELTGAEQAILLAPNAPDVTTNTVDALVVAATAGRYSSEVIGQQVPMEGSTTGGVAQRVISVGEPAEWSDLPPLSQQRLTALRDGDLLTPSIATAGAAGIALQHPDGILAVWIDLPEQRLFTLEDQTPLAVLAGRLGQGLQRLHQVDQQRETALALQHAILGPARLPAGISVRYQAASRPLEVGGDWYDIIELDDGRIAFVVGDCVGRGLAAATVMGQVRSACRALLFDNPSSASVLSRLDRFAARLPGATLLLYTDGLIERRELALEQGLTLLTDAARENQSATLDDMAEEIMSGLAPGVGYQDDVVLPLLYRHHGPLSLEFPAELSEVAAIRGLLRGWLNEVLTDADQVMDVLVAAGEAVANAIEHGHRHSPGGSVSLLATALGNRLQLTITDTGVWKAPNAADSAHRGRGIGLMRALVHDVVIDSDTSGTTVHLIARITT